MKLKDTPIESFIQNIEAIWAVAIAVSGVLVVFFAVVGLTSAAAFFVAIFIVLCTIGGSWWWSMREVKRR